MSIFKTIILMIFIKFFIYIYQIFFSINIFNVHHKEGNEISLLDILCIEDNSIFEQVDFGIETNKLYEKIRDVLKPREKEILQKRYGLNNQKEKTQREIAEELGISRSY